MPTEPGDFGTLSNNLVFFTVVAYSLAMLGFAAALSFRRSAAARRPASAAAPVRVSAAAGSRVLVGANAAPAPTPTPEGSFAGGGQPVLLAGPEHWVQGRPAEGPPPAAGPSRVARIAGGLALALTVLGWLAHLAAIVARGVAADRLPWGNMYEFSLAVSFAAVTVFLYLVLRRGMSHLGVFVMLPVVLYLGHAAMVLYVAPGPLIPALQSYWMRIHVTGAIVASGAFMIATVPMVLYLVRLRYDERTAAGRRTGPSAVARLLPSADALDAAAYRVVVFAFPVWTFAVIAGAIWAEVAWGRYWGWDPKETWSFITWVGYACYLHARSTAGWRGKRAAYIGLLAFVALLIDYYGVNMVVSGLHSYAK